MYLHHATEPDASPPHMQHSLAQQLTRQDPFLYKLVVTLRGDHQWRFISIPRMANEVEQVEGGRNTALVQIVVTIPMSSSNQNGDVLALS